MAGLHGRRMLRLRNCGYFPWILPMYFTMLKMSKGGYKNVKTKWGYIKQMEFFFKKQQEPVNAVRYNIVSVFPTFQILPQIYLSWRRKDGPTTIERLLHIQTHQSVRPPLACSLRAETEELLAGGVRRNVWLSSSSVKARCSVVHCVNQLASVYWPSKMFVTALFIMILGVLAPSCRFDKIYDWNDGFSCKIKEVCF